VRKVLIITATTAVGTALLSCTTPQPVAYAPPAPQIVYEPSAPVGHAPLPPPADYASPPPQMINSSPPLATYGDSPYPRPQTAVPMVWHVSPRWAKVKQDPQAKFKRAQAKAAKVGVENLSKEDVDGLTPAQLKELRGY